MAGPIPLPWRALALAGLLHLSTPAAGQHAGHDPAPGVVHLAVPCNEAAQAAFDLGLLHQHSFDHAAAQAQFTAALGADPACAMAAWGLALATLDNLFGTPATEDLAEAARVLRDAPPAPPPWDGWVAALEGLVRPEAGAWPDRLAGFADAMGRIAAASPDNDEAQLFHALAILMAAPSDDPVDAAQREAAAILEPVWARQPDHPGAMHYLIHAYDTPTLAARGLPAARRYATVAAGSAHAVHMPAHIFTRLGDWAASVASNRRSAELARAAGSANDELHARDYLVYALLQSGRSAAAREAWAEAAAVVPRQNPDHLAGPFAIAAMPARLALETGDWAAAATLPVAQGGFPQVVAISRFARGIGRVRSGRPADAAAEVAALAALETSLQSSGQAAWAAEVAARRAAAAALAAIAAGDVATGLRDLRAAADAEDALLKNVVEPGPLAPARELLGEALLALGRAAEAEAAFEAVLRANPNRFRALAGAAAAAQANGRPGVALARYRLLRAISAEADAPRPELAEAARLLERRRD
jgi:tetratricopeptide (TPR) repeat protein